MNSGFFAQVTRDKPRNCCKAAQIGRKRRFVITDFLPVITGLRYQLRDPSRTSTQ
jgi:hypothetical protein